MTPFSKKRISVCFTFILMMISLSTFAQKTKEIKEKKIKSATTTITEYRAGKEITYKDEVTTFDNEGNALETIEYLPDGKVKMKTVFKNDSIGNVIEETMYDASGTIKRRKAYEFAGKRKTAEMTYGSSGKLTKKELFSYDETGLKVEKKSFSGDNKPERTKKYTYEFR